MKKYYVLFNYKNKNIRYYLIAESEDDAHHIATCLMYCNHLYNGSVILFPNIRIKTKLQIYHRDAGEQYKHSILQWIKRGYI